MSSITNPENSIERKTKFSDVPECINDPAALPEERIEALRSFAKGGGLALMTPFGGEINNHIHTIYSFSPYTPSMAALKARRAGLEAAGSVDHDSYAAAEEMKAATEILHMGCVTGLELRVSFRHTEFAERKINSPDSAGIAYMTIQGVPGGQADRIRDFLIPPGEARRQRNRLMTERLNGILSAAGLAELSYDRDIVPLSMAACGGSVTERHILYALSLSLIKEAGKGETLLAFIKDRLDLAPSGKTAAMLADGGNPFYAYDLLGLLKSSFNDRMYIQPGEDECPPVEKVTGFARSINAVPSYAYLGDVGESPTGDKKAEKFEDDYIEELMPRLRSLGFLGVTYMPPRNTGEQLARLHRLCEESGFIEISGVDINSPRQGFNCPEIRKPEFAMLLDSTWALAAHERLASADPVRGLFNPTDPLADRDLNERIKVFAEIGRKKIYG
ncbi:MAG: PHP domain-containing protein [Treponema sp.]|jgi:hypothetical protein|nr:PHP domain-containing protein [Treponema sp.]